MSHWRNKMGYKSVKDDARSTWWKAVYEITLDEGDAALTFVDNFGAAWRPDRHFYSDQGTIPRSCQLFIPDDRFLISFLLHDSAYIHGGLWRYSAFKQMWRFEYMTRRQADDLLHDMVLAEGGWESTASLIWAAVRAGGAFCDYGKGDGDLR